MEPAPGKQLPQRFPDCLRWKADKHEREDQLRELPSVLFTQLRQALRLNPAATWPSLSEICEPPDVGAPTPADLYGAWSARPPLPFATLELPVATIVSWLDSYAFAWPDRTILDDISREPVDPYVRGCARLLEGSTERVTIPLAVVDGTCKGRVQWLHLDVARGTPEAALFIHPEAAFTHAYFGADFAESLAVAWRLATEDAADAPTVFWHITETDGKPIISEQQNGTSASAAAFRAFWHVRRGLSLDAEVYVLGSCAGADGSIQDVGGIAQKIAAVREHRQAFGIQTPGTLVLSAKPNGRIQHDHTAIIQAESWAVVHQVSTLAELTAVRSCESTAAISYLRHLADSLDQCRLLPMGKRLSEVHVPPQVWKDERIRPEHETGWRDELETDAASGPEERDSPPKKRRVRQPWERVFQMHRGRSPLVLVGGPGSGKSTVLHWTAREMAREAVAALESRASHPAGVCWPVLVNLDTWAAHKTDLQSRPSLISLITDKVPDEMPQLLHNAVTQLIEKRLRTATEHTCLFFDSLDQVALARGDTLRKRLAALSDLTSRLVLTTRESGLRTHDEAMKTLPTPVTVQSAPLMPEDARTLAANWLGAEQAARLERHLRSHPSLGIVADSPLLLTLACLVASEKPGLTLPETPAALYQEMTQLLAQGRWRNGDDAPPASHDPQALLDQLPAIAWRLFVRSPGVNRFDRETMLEAIRQNTSLKGKAATDFLDFQLVELGFVEASQESKTEPQYEFRHTTLLEFLAARHLATTVHLHTWAAATVDAWQDGTGWHTAKVGDLLDAQAFEPSWEPVILFVAGLLKEPLPLIEMLADRRKDDLYRYRLGLLCRCCGSIASENESSIRPSLDGALRNIERILNRAVRRRPEGWRRWLENIGNLMALPVTGKKAVQMLVALGKGRHEMRIHGDDDIVDLLAKRAGGLDPKLALEGLLQLCVGDMETRVREKTATTLVECAEASGEIDFLSRLESAALELADKPWQQVAIYGGMLASRDAEAVDRAIHFLKQKAQDYSAEEWVRSSAAHQLINLIGREQEMKAAPFLIEAFLNPSTFCFRHGYGHTFASDIVWAVYRRPSDFGSALTLLILRTHANYRQLAKSCGEALAKSRDEDVRKIGFKVLRELMNSIQEKGVNDADHLYGLNAAKNLAELGDEEQRAEAVQFLWKVARLPITDAYNQYFAIEALIEAGVPYDEHMSRVFEQCVSCPTSPPIRLAHMASKAREHGDNTIAQKVLPQLEWIVEVAKPGPWPTKPLPFDRDVAARALYETHHWPSLLESAFARLNIGMRESSEADWFAVSTIAFGAHSSAIVDLLPILFRAGKMNFRPWHRLLRELTKRGWRLRLRGRKIEVLRRGQEAPRADADFGY